MYIDQHSNMLFFLVPGDGGSQVDAKLDKPEVVHYICNKKTDDYFNTWLNLELLVPVAIDCLVSFFHVNSNLRAGIFRHPCFLFRQPAEGVRLYHIAKQKIYLDPYNMYHINVSRSCTLFIRIAHTMQNN